MTDLDYRQFRKMVRDVAASVSRSYPSYVDSKDTEGALWLWLYRTKTGMVIRAGVDDMQMARAVGIPARIAVGLVYVLGAQGAFYYHAWPEVYLEGVGWVVLDIAAAENLDPSRPPQDEDDAERAALTESAPARTAPAPRERHQAPVSTQCAITSHTFHSRPRHRNCSGPSCVPPGPATIPRRTSTGSS